MKKPIQALGALISIMFASASLASVFNMSELDGTNGFSMNSSNLGDNIGWGEVRGIGDFDGDGIDDFVVGTSSSPGYETDYIGRAYLVYGNAQATYADIDLNNLETESGSQGFLINGVSLGDGVGMTIGKAGDVNNDGLADIIIGGHLFSNKPNEAYVVYGFSGKSTNKFELNTLTGGDGSQGFRLHENAPGAAVNSGMRVAGGGDINGDGVDDLIIGSSYANDLSERVQQVGRTYVVYGSGNTLVSDFNMLDLITGDGSAGFVAIGEAQTDHAGTFIDNAGDFNNDGFSDVIIAALNAADSAGKVYVVFGGQSDAILNLSDITNTTGFVIQGDFATDGILSGDRIGTVAGIGDFNGDTFDDVLIGASSTRNQTDPGLAGPGRLFIVFGKSDTTVGSINAGSLRSGDGSTGFEISQEASPSASTLGNRVSSVGDFNGDGLNDLLGNSRNGTYLLYGTNTNNVPLVSLSEASSTKGVLFYAESPGTTFSTRVGAAGDFNNDGVDDILLASRAVEKTYIVFGNINTSPRISRITNTIIGANRVSDPVAFTISDSEDVSDDLVLEANSSNPDVIPVSGITFSGTGSERSVTLTPATNMAGSTDISIVVTDLGGVQKTGTFSVTVRDIDAPIITLNGTNPQSLTVGSTYTEAGATAADDIDGDLTDSIAIDSSDVNTAVTGTYTVTYRVLDAAGNLVEATRSVRVNSATPTPAPPSSSGGGGGSISWFELIFMSLIITLLSIKKARFRNKSSA